MVKDLLPISQSEVYMNNNITLKEIEEFFSNLYDYEIINFNKIIDEIYFVMRNFGKISGESLNTNSICELSNDVLYSNETKIEE